MLELTPKLVIEDERKKNFDMMWHSVICEKKVSFSIICPISRHSSFFLLFKQRG
jgi:hypothetical protein